MQVQDVAAAKPSPSVPWTRGLLSAFLEWGSPDLPACGPWHGSTSGLVRLFVINPSSRPSRGAKPRGADDTMPPQGWPHQAGSRGGGEIKARGTSRGAHDASHDDQDQAGARQAPACAVSRFLFGAKGASAGTGYRGIRQRLPFQCNKTKTNGEAGWRSPWSPRRRHHQCLWQPKTNFSQHNLY